MTRQRVIFAVGAVLSGLLYWPGQGVTLERQGDLYARLLDAAGIIFTVMGIWVALLYPQAREAIMKVRRIRTPEETRVVELLRPMLTASVVLGSVLLHGTVAEVARTLPVAHRYLTQLRGASFAVLGALTLALAWSVLQTLLPMLYIREDLAEQRKHEDRRAGLRQTGS